MKKDKGDIGTFAIWRPYWMTFWIYHKSDEHISILMVSMHSLMLKPMALIKELFLCQRIKELRAHFQFSGHLGNKSYTKCENFTFDLFTIMA